MTGTATEERTHTPNESQNVVHFREKTYTAIREGNADILTPHASLQNGSRPKQAQGASKSKDEDPKQNVFYNPIQQFNRDISVLAIKAFAEDFVAEQVTRQQRKESTLMKKGSRGKKRKRGQDKPPTIGSKESNDILFLQSKGQDPKSTSSESHENGGEGGNAVVDPESDTKKSLLAKNISVAQSTDASCTHSDEQEKPTSNENVEVNGVSYHETESQNKLPSSQFRILDALSATGLRALRYAKEIPMATSINANDLSPTATESIRINISYNKLEKKITTTTADAMEHMYSTASHVNSRSRRYQVIDLDPYGTAVPFLDAAIRAIDEDGLICVTCTDSAIFASTGYLEKTFSQYGGLPLKGPQAHEAGLRLVLHAIATSAARYGIDIEPLLSLSVDYYIRVFVRVRKSPADVKLLASKTMLVYNCDFGCGAWETQFLAQAKGKENRNGETVYKFTCAVGPTSDRKCEHCGSMMHVGGPIWGGALHNPIFVQRVLDMLPELDQSIYQTVPRIEGILSMALEENLDDPWAPQSPSPPRNKTTEESQDSNHLGKNHDESVTPLEITTDKPSDLTVISDRLIPHLPSHYRDNHPFFIHPPLLARALNSVTPSEAQLRGALRGLGYRTSRSHTKPGSIKTNAPWPVIWEIMREWVRQSERFTNIKPRTVAWRLMQKDRSRATLEGLKKELNEKIKGIQSLDELKTQLEAGLGRLSTINNQSTSSFSVNPINTSTTTSNEPSSVGPQPATFPETASETDIPGPKMKPSTDLSTLNVRFDEELGDDTRYQTNPGGDNEKNGKRKRLKRYQVNPPNWGPLTKAKG